ncbi:MAG TPA: tetratricopeptide repeat protein [Polyangia bacterium]|jgi:hypothetical protein
MRAENQDPTGPTRWRESGGDPSALGARAAELVDAMREAPPLGPEALSRIRAGVLARRPSRVGTPLPLGLRFALLTTVVLASVATAKGTMFLWRRHVEAAAAVTPPHRAAHERPRAIATEAVTPPVIVELPAPPVAQPATTRAPARRRVAMAEPRAAQGRSTEASTDPSTEARLLSRALGRLRHAHDPAGAMELLDQYARAFPHGVLESEALSARLEAVIQLDDRKTALALLDHREAFAGRLGAQLLLTRAELRASAGRYADAVRDFDRLLGTQEAMGAADLERALYGRGVCLGHLDKGERARVDLADYQRRFPSGKHAAEVARLLKGAGAESRP